jgi:hypothetical protein
MVLFVVQLSLAVQESADKLRILADLESTSKGEQVAGQGNPEIYEIT